MWAGECEVVQEEAGVHSCKNHKMAKGVPGIYLVVSES